MNCEQVEELLSPCLDNVLVSEEHTMIVAHLQVCSRCSAILADYRRFDTLLSNLPRVSPDTKLRSKIFSSAEYVELAATFATGSTNVLHPRSRPDRTGRPYLVAFPGGRSSAPPTARQTVMMKVPRRRGAWGLRIMRAMIVATLLLTLSVGSFIGWKLWMQQEQTTMNVGGITPPAGLSQGPLPAGTRFVFLRDGSLWSGSADVHAGVVRLTPTTVTVAANWAVRPATPGHLAGDMLAYIDLQRGSMHTIRSDGQNDIVIQQALLKAGVQPSTVWDTPTGVTILESVAWSSNGSMLAFVGDPNGTGQLNLYIYSLDTGSVHMALLPMKGAVSHPVWSPDGIRVAFELTSDKNIEILDYNTQNRGVLTITSTVDTQQNPNDKLLDLDWSPSVDSPVLTWSVGIAGHVHNLWMRPIDVDTTIGTSMLTTGDYTQATYSRSGHGGVGSWLLVSASTEHTRDILRFDLTLNTERLTSGRQVSFIQWSPDGTYVDYLDGPTSALGALHIMNTFTDVDTLVTMGVTDAPVPIWSIDSQRLVYSTGMHVLVVSVQGIKTPQTLMLHGSASAFAWSTTQLIVAISDGMRGIYLVDTQSKLSKLLDTMGVVGSILWTEIP